MPASLSYTRASRAVEKTAKNTLPINAPCSTDTSPRPPLSQSECHRFTIHAKRCKLQLVAAAPSSTYRAPRSHERQEANARCERERSTRAGQVCARKRTARGAHGTARAWIRGRRRTCGSAQGSTRHCESRPAVAVDVRLCRRRADEHTRAPRSQLARSDRQTLAYWLFDEPDVNDWLEMFWGSLLVVIGLKQLMDPVGILNPHKVLPSSSSSSS